MVYNLKEKQLKLKDELNKKDELNNILINLKTKEKCVADRINSLNNEIKTSNEFKQIINKTSFNNLTIKEFIIKIIISITIIILTIFTNLIINKLLMNIGFVSNYISITILSIVEAFINVEHFLITPYKKSQILKNSMKEMAKYVLTPKEIALIKDEVSKEIIKDVSLKKDINEIITMINLTNDKIKQILLELINDDKIKELIIDNFMNNNDLKKELNLITTNNDYSSKARTRKI